MCLHFGRLLDLIRLLCIPTSGYTVFNTRSVLCLCVNNKHSTFFVFAFFFPVIACSLVFLHVCLHALIACLVAFAIDAVNQGNLSLSIEWSFVGFFCCSLKWFPSLHATGGEIEHWRFPGAPARGVPRRVLLWSGSYGLCAKVNQFFKNLGAPAPPRQSIRLCPCGELLLVWEPWKKKIK